ncbi:hypothetical protein CYMTET_5245 [Cymbomonas tetramitiformis]|uniref:Uncharacterized protein n=1 Tax=Cymbomonas tetramitiformis TaxID=36881 RepID=A0AAE0GZT9_9CHLO|nr:hypothetical protein CYMTET_5245 [Cymbomonas tetramitiformis]
MASIGDQEMEQWDKAATLESIKSRKDTILKNFDDWQEQGKKRAEVTTPFCTEFIKALKDDFPPENKQVNLEKYFGKLELANRLILTGAIFKVVLAAGACETTKWILKESEPAFQLENLKCIGEELLDYCMTFTRECYSRRQTSSTPRWKKATTPTSRIFQASFENLGDTADNGKEPEPPEPPQSGDESEEENAPEVRKT